MKAKANSMTPHFAAVPAGRPHIGLVRTTARKLSGRVHAADADRARALGWKVTETPGSLGLRGRDYRDPRFAARRRAIQDAHAGTDGRDE
jgi:hypothetical protein